MTILANGFYRQGYPVDVVLLKRTGPYLDELDSGINVIDLGSRRAFLSLFPLVRYFLRVRPAAVLATQMHINILSIVARTVARVPIRLVVREACTPSVITRNQGSVKAWLVLKLLAAFYPLADRIISPSKGVMVDLIKELGLSENHVMVIPNPLPLATIQRFAQQPPDHRWFRDRIPVVLGIGRLSNQKDFRTLIRAFAKVSAHRETRLIILGEGEDRAELQRMVGCYGLDDRVELIGFVANPFAYLRRSAVYVLSSPSEGLPNTLLEAMALEVPVVATDCLSGPREILEDGRWGRLIGVGDVDAMAVAIVSALDGQLVTAPLSTMKVKYGVNHIVQQYLEVLTCRELG